MRTKILNVFKNHPDCEFTLDEICARFPKVKRRAISQYIWQLTNNKLYKHLELIKGSPIQGKAHSGRKWKYAPDETLGGEELFMIGGDKHREPRTKEEYQKVLDIKRKAMGISFDRSKVCAEQIGFITNEWIEMSAPKPQLQEFINSRI